MILSLTPSPRLTSTDRMGFFMTTYSISSLCREVSLSLLVRFLPDYFVSLISLQQMVSSLLSFSNVQSNWTGSYGRLAGFGSLDFRRTDLLRGCSFSCGFCLLKDIFLGMRVTLRLSVVSDSSSTIMMLLVLCSFFWLKSEPFPPYRMRLTLRAKYSSQISNFPLSVMTILRLLLICSLLLTSFSWPFWQQLLVLQWLMQVRNSNRLWLGTPLQFQPYSSCHIFTRYFSSYNLRRQCSFRRIWKVSQMLRKHSVSRRCSWLLWSSWAIASSYSVLNCSTSLGLIFSSFMPSFL